MDDLAFIHQRSLPTLSYLVLVQPMLVAVDISLAIADVVTRANVIVARGALEADEALKSIDSVHVAFLGLAPTSIMGMHFANAVRARGGGLVFIGDEAEAIGPGPDWTVLVRPFTTECVFAALKEMSKPRARFPMRQSRHKAASSFSATDQTLANDRCNGLCPT